MILILWPYCKQGRFINNSTQIPHFCVSVGIWHRNTNQYVENLKYFEFLLWDGWENMYMTCIWPYQYIRNVNFLIDFFWFPETRVVG